MSKSKMWSLLMRKSYLFKCSFRLLLYLFLLFSLFYFSLALEVYLQIKNADKFATQHIELMEKHSNKYIYEKDLYFTPPRATFLTNGSRIYVYISDSIFKQLKLEDLHIEVIRENHGETKKYEFDYPDSEEAVQPFQRLGFHCLAFPAIKLHIDYNNIKFIISGISVSNPDKNLKITLNFGGIKRRAVFSEYLLKGLLLLGGCILVFSLSFLIEKLSSKIKHARR